jgi:phage tail-like protein
MAVAERIDPVRAYNFKVQLDGVTVAGFREVSGLSFTTDVVEYREGTDQPLHPRKLRGIRKFANIVCKKGMTNNKELFNWYKQTLNGDPKDRKNGAVILTDEEHKQIQRWNFDNAWITKWEGPMLNATANDVAVETIEIAVERVVMA